MISETYMNAVERFLQNKAMYLTATLIKQHAVYKNYLLEQLKVDNRLNWETLFMPQSHEYAKGAPHMQHFLQKYAITRLHIKDIIFFWRWIRKKRLLKNAVCEYDHAQKQYEIEKKQFNDKVSDYNQSILMWKKAFEQGDPAAIERYADIILKSVTDLYNPRASTFSQYNITDKELYIELMLPTPNQFPSIKEYRYDTVMHRIVEVYFSEEELANTYNEITNLIIAGVIHKIFCLIPALHLSYISFSGFHEGSNPKHELVDASCTISLRTSRETFLEWEKDIQDNQLELKNLEAQFDEPLDKYPITSQRNYFSDPKSLTPIRSFLNQLGSETPLNFVNWNAFDYFIHQKFDFLS